MNNLDASAFIFHWIVYNEREEEKVAPGLLCDIKRLLRPCSRLKGLRETVNVKIGNRGLAVVGSEGR